jgi:hypothetical protein
VQAETPEEANVLPHHERIEPLGCDKGRREAQIDVYPEALEETDVLPNHGGVEPPAHCEGEGKLEVDAYPKEEVNVLPSREEDYEIQLLEGAELSIFHSYGSMLEQELEATKENLNEHQDKGFIRESSARRGLQLFQPVEGAALPLSSSSSYLCQNKS